MREALISEERLANNLGEKYITVEPMDVFENAANADGIDRSKQVVVAANKSLGKVELNTTIKTKQRLLDSDKMDLISKHKVVTDDAGNKYVVTIHQGKLKKFNAEV